MLDKNQDKKRLFFGLDLPKEEKAKIFKWLETHVQSNRKPTLEQNLHLTLAFLAEVDPINEAKLIKFAKTLSMPSFELIFEDCDYWQNTGILFLKPKFQPHSLITLANSLRDFGQQQNLYSNPFSFHPHITLMRGCKKMPNITQPISSVRVYFEAFKLFHSTRVNDQLRYLPLYSFPLR